MRASKLGMSTIAIMAVIVGVIAIATLGAFAYAIPYLYSGSGSSTQVSMTTRSIVGNDVSETVTISSDTEIDLTCNFCVITLNVNSGVTINLDTVGNYNQVTVNGGSANLSGSGNDNTFYLHNTKVLSNTMIGNGNSIQS
jgi:hypothetical protein